MRTGGAAAGRVPGASEAVGRTAAAGVVATGTDAAEAVGRTAAVGVAAGEAVARAVVMAAAPAVGGSEVHLVSVGAAQAHGQVDAAPVGGLTVAAIVARRGQIMAVIAAPPGRPVVVIAVRRGPPMAVIAVHHGRAMAGFAVQVGHGMVDTAATFPRHMRGSFSVVDSRVGAG